MIKISKAQKKQIKAEFERFASWVISSYISELYKSGDIKKYKKEIKA